MPKKSVTYIRESGVEARGQNYKRVAREVDKPPRPTPKKPTTPPDKGHGHEPVPSKEHAAPAAAEKKDKPKAQPKEHGGGHGSRHGATAASQEPRTSQLYDPTVIKLNGANRPFTAIVQSNAYADYYVCRDTVSTAYRETVLKEMNSFADRMALAHARASPCMVKIAKPTSKLPGAVFIEFFVDDEAARECMIKADCGETRTVLLYVPVKTDHGHSAIYRSYALADERQFRRASFCVSPAGELLAEKSCYVVLNPDWLFN